MNRLAKAWLAQQVHKRHCTCPAWWQWETQDVLWLMLWTIWIERGEL